MDPAATEAAEGQTSQPATAGDSVNAGEEDGEAQEEPEKRTIIVSR